MPKLDKRQGMSPYPLRLPDELLQTLRQVAAQENRSVNAQIEVALKQWIAEVRKKARDEPVPA